MYTNLTNHLGSIFMKNKRFIFLLSFNVFAAWNYFDTDGLDKVLVKVKE